MITITQKLKLIQSCFGKYKLSGNEKNVSIVCPFCIKSGKDTNKKKLSIDLDTGIYHCWVCESKGRNIGRPALKYARDTSKAKELANIYGGIKKKEDEEIKEEILALPEDFKMITNFSSRDLVTYKHHIRYLKNRGLSLDHCHRMCIGVSDSYEYKNRVIFPSIDALGNLNFFVARTIDPKNTFRYKNAKVSRKEVIFNHFNLDFKKEMILTEGVFDLTHTPVNSTCILGSWLDENYLLFKEIVKNKTPVVLCLDPDARGKANKIMKLFNEYCIPARISTHTKKDFADMTKEEVLYHIEKAKPLDFVMGVRYLIENINSGSMF